MEKPDERHKCPMFTNAYIHPSICITVVSWDFLEEMEDKLGETIMISSGSKHGQVCGTNMAPTFRYVQALSDVLLTPASPASPPHTSTRQGDTDSTIDVALVSPTSTQWTRTETLASHGGGHLPVVFGLQKLGIEPRRKAQVSSMVSQTQVWCQSCDLASQLTQQMHDRKPSSSHPDEGTMVQLWLKERNELHPDLTIKAHMEEKTEVFKRVASEAKSKQWGNFCFLFL